MEKLSEYRRKRNFRRTAEPAGGGKREKKQDLIYAVQYHVATRAHYDLRLEWKGVLLSWAVPKGPSFRLGDRRLAVMVEDHPVEYAGFEGVIPKGEYGGGPVMLWDEGSWEPLTDPDEGLREGALKFRIDGKRLRGRWALVRMKTEAGEQKNWLLLKERDEYAGEEGIPDPPTSIRSGRTAEEIRAEEDLPARKNPFRRAEVMLAKTASEPPEGEEWLFEVKYDGYRILAFAEGGEVRLMTRGGSDYTRKFRTAAEAAARLAGGRAMVLDGEMVVPDAEGRTDFQALQDYGREPGGRALVYMVFDLLALDGEDLRGLPLLARRDKLAALLQDAPEGIVFSRHVAGRGRESLQAAERAGFEGIMAKRADSPYRGGRSGDWLKLKCRPGQEFVVGGYTRTGKKAGVSSVLLGVYEDGKLRYAGRAGTGLTLRGAAELEREFRKYGAETPAFADPPRPRRGEETFWLRPELVAEVQFAEWTREGVLRQASFKGLRGDKAPGEVRREAGSGESRTGAARTAAERAGKSAAGGVGGVLVRGVQISSPDRIVFRAPETTKLGVVRYYEAAAERMLPHAAGRVLSVVRCHKGVDGSCFFRKHPAGPGEGTRVVPVRSAEGGVSDYFCIEDIRGLLGEVQLGSIEFHVWGSRADEPERPDRMVFDLDPDEGMPLARIRQGVRDLKSVLDALSLRSYLKTSGGKGYHIVVPFRPVADWTAFRDFARRVAEVMEREWPDRYTANMRKSRRQGRIFIDWVRNGRGATSVAPYSLRARPGAKVSVPLAWEELDEIAPDGIDIQRALARLSEPDPWRGISSAGRELK